MIDIVIPLIKHDLFDHMELKYTLRSIEKFLTGYRNVYLVGYQPEWCQNVIHIPYSDFGTKPNINIKDKLMAACEVPAITEFLYFNDDHILTQPFSTYNFPFFYDGLLFDRIHKKNQTVYNKLVEKTWEILYSQPNHQNNFFYYDVHTPILIDCFAFKDIMSQYNWSDMGYLVKSLYANNLPINNHQQTKDIKVLRPIREKAHWLEIIQNNPVVSTDAGTLNDLFVEVMEEMFPKKSKYEM